MTHQTARWKECLLPPAGIAGKQWCRRLVSRQGPRKPGIACRDLVTYAPTLDTICIEKSHQIIAGMMIASVIRQAAAVAARPIRVR
jgi:hypothetical protein